MLCGAWHEKLALLIVLVDDARVGARELRRPGHDRAQHGPEVQGGTDRLTDLAERPKLGYRPCQILGPGFEFLEQSHVLDGDHGLVGEGLEEIDVLLNELSGLPPIDHNRTDGVPAAEHRHAEQASKASPRGADASSAAEFLVSAAEFLVSEGVGYLGRRASEDRPTRDIAAVRRHRILLPKHCDLRLAEILMSRQVDKTAIQ